MNVKKDKWKNTYSGIEKRSSINRIITQNILWAEKRWCSNSVSDYYLITL